MLRNWMRLSTLPVLAVLAFAACSDQSDTASDLIAPDAPEFAKGGGNTGKGGKGGPTQRTTQGRGRNGASTTFKFALGRPPADSTEAKKWIGPEGGNLYAAGHGLYVPKGAVTEPTHFKLYQYRTFLPGDTVAVVAVDLKAYRYDAAGNVVDVGEQGFPVPVYLYLTYGWSTNLHDNNVVGSKILWLKAPDYAEEVASQILYDTEKNIVYTALSHFSDYALALP